MTFIFSEFDILTCDSVHIALCVKWTLWDVFEFVFVKLSIELLSVIHFRVKMIFCLLLFSLMIKVSRCV